MILYLVAGTDYGKNATHYNVTIVLPAGTDCSSFDIPIHDDYISEEDESFMITIWSMSLPYGIMLGDNHTTEVFIKDNDSE